MRPLLFAALACLCASCSIFLGFEECESDGDCANGTCSDGVCSEPGADGGLVEDTGMTDLGARDMGDMSEPQDTGSDLSTPDAAIDMTADAATDMPDMFVDPNRPDGRTTCNPAPISDITEPKATVGNGNAVSCTFAALQTAVAAGGLITFDCGVNPHTIVFTERIEVRTDVHLDGGDLITFDGNNSTRLFLIDAPFNSESPHLVLEELTLANGYATTADFLCGAAVARPGGSLTVISSRFENNGCDGVDIDDDPVGGTIGALDGGPLVIFGSEFVDSTSAGGGALFLRDLDVEITNTRFANCAATDLSGGAITGFGQTNLTICGATFEDNVSENFGGSIFYRDATAPPAAVTISQSTFARNAAIEDGGAADLEGAVLSIDSSTFSANVSGRGGALWLGEDELSMVNVTFSGNESTSESGGAIYYSDTTGTIEHTTFSNNIASGTTQGSIIGSADDAGASLTFRNSILYNNLVSIDPAFCLVAQLDAGGNVQWPDTTTGCAPGVIFADPMLGTLAQNGGLTSTILPQAQTVVDIGADCPRFDQRGVVRPADNCTVGATQLE